jgi:aspartyl-tRNA synthetase
MKVTQQNNFVVFDSAELVLGICAKGCAEWSRKQLDAMTDYVKRPQIGAKGTYLLQIQCRWLLLNLQSINFSVKKI